MYGRTAETSPSGCPVSKWFHQQWRHGYQVRHALLEVCDDDKRKQVELQWIWRFPRDDLLNRRKKNNSRLTIGTSILWLPYRPPKLPRIAEIENYMRRYKNVDGFPGIQCDHDTGYYRVLVYNGRWAPQWLHDDELADGPWFSDLARAVNARDKHFNHAAYMRSHYNRALIEARRREDIVASRARYEKRIRTEQGGYDYTWD
jgi:hypothetical protein